MIEISVIIPTYNSLQFINQTIQSVLNQTNVDLEIIVVDDGSTDNTNKIIEELIKKDNRLKYYYQKNQGVSKARNFGFSMSSGRFIAFLDSDDILLPDSLKRKLERLNVDEKEFGLVHSDMAVIDEHGNQTGSIICGREGWLLKNLLLWDGTNIPGPSSILVKREVIEKIGGFDSDFSTAADQDFFFRVALDYKIAHIPEILGLYRIHSMNMHSNIGLMEKDHIKVYKKAKKEKYFYSSWFRRKCFANLYLILAGSWWVDGMNKNRGGLFLIKSFFVYPPILSKIFIKVFRKML